MLEPRGNLPPINFAEKSATEVESSIITVYESIANRTLQKGDPIRLFLESIAAIIINQRSIIDFSAKQNLLSYVTNQFVDYLGELVGVYRIEAKAAQTTIRFTLSETQGSVYTIPAGTLLNAGELDFATTENLEIAIGETVGEVTAECTTAGTVGNDLLPGQIKTLVEPLPYMQKAENITTTNGGSEEEGVESMVERIRLAPSSFSVAGPRDAYIYWALTANAAIVDVAVSAPQPDDIRQLIDEVLTRNNASQALIDDMNTTLDNATWPGTVDIRPLLEDGEIPLQEVLDQVDAVLSSDDVRPMTDNVKVTAPTAVSYNLEMEYWINSDDVVEAGSIQQGVNKAVQDYLLWQKSKIGRDINPDELTAKVKQAGAKRVVITSPSFKILTDTEVAQENTVTVNYQGLEDG